MLTNPVIESMLNRKSVRKYTDQKPTDEVIDTVVRAGQQAPFASQLCSVLLSRKKAPYGAPLWFTFCVDAHRLEVIMAKRGWTMVECDLSLLLMGIQDVALMAENMVIAAESLGMGSCFLGMAPYRAERIQKQYHLPKRVFPLVELVMGYPAEEFPPRPRYPLEFALFEDRYPEMDEAMVTRAMQAMDEGYLAQDYYRRHNVILPLDEGKKEGFTFDNYSWTEHISRKLGQWSPSPERLLKQLASCGFNLTKEPGTGLEAGGR